MTTLTLIAHLHVKPEKVKQLKKICEGFVAPTRAEAGCLDYHFHISNDDPLHFMFYETWKNRKIFEAHLKTPHLRKFWATRMKYLRKDVDITFFTMHSPHV